MSVLAFPRGVVPLGGLLAAFVATGACAKGSVTIVVGGGTTTLTTSSTGGASTSSGTGGTGGGLGDAASDGPIACNHASDCSSLTDTCNIGACLNNVCIQSPTNEGGACDDGMFCTVNDMCTMGTCTGMPMSCPGMDACHTGTCDESTKSCTQMPGNDGAFCSPTDPCYSSGFCSSGSCVGETMTNCTFLDTQCATGTCQPGMGCVATPLPNGTFCSSGMFCTVNEACTNGMCQGTPRMCPPATGTCMSNTCVEADFACEPMQAQDGTACSSGNSCVTGEACTAGTCQGGTPVADGTPCTASSACIANPSCTGGKCTGTPITACVNGDGCCPPGCTAANDSDCTCSVDLALTASPSMSPGGSAPGHGAEELNNGIGKSQCQNFSWISSNTTCTQTGGCWFELDWTTAQNIASIYIEAEPADGSGQCGEPGGRDILTATVQTWNGSAWVTSGMINAGNAMPDDAGANASGDIQLDINPPVLTTKLRLNAVTDSPGNGNAMIFEWHVFSAQGCIPPPD